MKSTTAYQHNLYVRDHRFIKKIYWFKLSTTFFTVGYLTDRMINELPIISDSL